MTSKYIECIEGYNYQLTEDYTALTNIRPQYNIDTDFISLSCMGQLTLRKGFAWDGASGALDTEGIMRAACEHDAFYRLMRMEELPRIFKDLVDKRFEQVIKEDTKTVFENAIEPKECGSSVGSFIGGIRGWYSKLAVKLFGKSSTLTQNRKIPKRYPNIGDQHEE